MVQTHQDSREEGTTTPFPLRRLRHGSPDPQNVLQLHHREDPDRLHQRLVSNCSASDRKALQRVVRTAQCITGAKLPAIQDLYNRRCQRKAQKIVRDSSHPSHRLFSKKKGKGGDQEPDDHSDRAPEFLCGDLETYQKDNHLCSTPPIRTLW
jgi:hypothetical protein